MDSDHGNHAWAIRCGSETFFRNMSPMLESSPMTMIRHCLRTYQTHRSVNIEYSQNFFAALRAVRARKTVGWSSDDEIEKEESDIVIGRNFGLWYLLDTV